MELPLVDVNKDTAGQTWPLLQLAVKQAHFIALDLVCATSLLMRPHGIPYAIVSQLLLFLFFYEVFTLACNRVANDICTAQCFPISTVVSQIRVLLHVTCTSITSLCNLY